ncbi:transketolase family protein [Streptomyces sp. NPDC058678]|uniref:transketolase family protein n=1 Tax=Streptomyces sp. NPDC058678 TaxID=3346595 RepID=UPI00366154B5
MIRPPSQSYGQLLVELGQGTPDLVVLDAGLGTSMETADFRAAYPDRYFNLGIAEQNAVGVASGLAHEGYVPLLHSFANFLVRRAHDQVAVSVAWPGRSVKLIAGHCGLWDGRNGPSHTSYDDLAGILNLPGMLVVEPADQTQTRHLMAEVIAYDGPAYVRLRRHGMPRDLAGAPLNRGSVLVRQAPARPACTVVAAGTMLAEALHAARLLGDTGTHVDLIGVAVLAPANLEPVLQSAARSGMVAVIENHAPHGGLADVVAAAVSPFGLPVHRFTLPKEFLPAGDSDWLLTHCGLAGPQLAARIEQVLDERTSEVG